MWLKCSSVNESTFFSRELCFVFFQSLGSLKTFAPVLSKSSELCWFPRSKTEHYEMMWQCANKISRNKTRIVVIAEYIVYESCWCCRREEYIKSRKLEMLLFWSCLSKWICIKQVKLQFCFLKKSIQDLCKVVTIEFWKFHGRVSVYAAYYYFFIF